jgi:hypothetical protein
VSALYRNDEYKILDIGWYKDNNKEEEYLLAKTDDGKFEVLKKNGDTYEVVLTIDE